jgi:signal-transduction protein with cAMP-binding, CBS, and nucleotidyltransferase domain
MRDENVGDVLVTQDGMLCGLLTDRDIVVRAVAEGRDLTGTRLADVCSAGIVTVSPDEAAEVALRLMRDRAVRRLPVVEDGRPVGVVSVGDLTSGRDEASDREEDTGREEATGRSDISGRGEHTRRSVPATLTH